MSAVVEKTLATEKIDEVFDRQWKNRLNIAKTDAKTRIAKLKKLMAWIEANEAAIQEAGYKDYKKPAAEVSLGDIIPAIAEIRHTIKHLKNWMKPKLVKKTLAMASASARLHYEPKGVVLIIAPWNYPFQLAVGPLVSAIAAGNCACIKPSEMTPHFSAVMARMVSELFEEDEIALFEGEVEVSTALLAKPFNHIFFTGSPAVGKIIMKAAAQHLSDITLELGGKSPTIVDETADINDTAAKIAWGKFLNNGQTCIAPDYVLVHESRRDALVQKLIERIEGAYGKTAEERKASKDYSRIVNNRHYQRVVNLLDASVDLGAEILYGGERDSNDDYLEPTLIGNVDLESPAMQEEIFGPVLPILTYKSFDEVFDLINSKEKPLALYLFTSSKANTDLVLSNTTAGGSCINDVAIHFFHQNLPFGGVNNSGIGNAHGWYGFKAFSHERAVLSHHKFSAIKMMMPPYTEKVEKLIGMLKKL